MHFRNPFMSILKEKIDQKPETYSFTQKHGQIQNIQHDL